MNDEGAAQKDPVSVGEIEVATTSHRPDLDREAFVTSFRDHLRWPGQPTSR
jgi:hypothetical protein